MRIRVVSVGRDKKGWSREAVDLYAGRVRRYVPLDLVELPASRAREPSRARADEGERILGTAAPGFAALDTSGRGLSSEAFARFVERHMIEARDLDLVLGGDEGLDPRVLEAAGRTLSLGPMTLPHRLARVVLLEQLYRAMSLVRGEPYHK